MLLQHLIVGIVFAICIYLIVRHMSRHASQTRKGNHQCCTCGDSSCPLYEIYATKKSENEDIATKKKTLTAKNCKKKKDIYLSIRK